MEGIRYVQTVFTIDIATGRGTLIAVLLLSLGYAWHVRSSLRGTADGSARILKLGHGLPTDHPVHMAMSRMAERVP